MLKCATVVQDNPGMDPSPGPARTPLWWLLCTFSLPPVEPFSCFRNGCSGKSTSEQSYYGRLKTSASMQGWEHPLAWKAQNVQLRLYIYMYIYNAYPYDSVPSGGGPGTKETPTSGQPTPTSTTVLWYFLVLFSSVLVCLFVCIRVCLFACFLLVCLCACACLFAWHAGCGPKIKPVNFQCAYSLRSWGSPPRRTDSQTSKTRSDTLPFREPRKTTKIWKQDASISGKSCATFCFMDEWYKHTPKGN